MCGEVHDESAFTLAKTMTLGSAGPFSTAPDILNFLSMIIQGGVYEGKQILSEATCALLPINRIGHLNLSTALGWELNQPRFMGLNHSGKTIGKTGFTGSSIVCDLHSGVGFTFLSNFTWPTRKKDVTNINRVRTAVADAVFAEYGKSLL